MPLFVVSDDQQALLTFPFEIAVNPTFHFLGELYSSSLDSVFIESDEHPENRLPGLSILPITWRGDLLDMGWKFAFLLEFQEPEKYLPCTIVLPYDLLSCGRTDIGRKGFVFFTVIPIHLPFEKGLPSFIIKDVPKGCTAFGPLKSLILVLESYCKSISSLHAIKDKDLRLFNSIGSPLCQNRQSLRAKKNKNGE